MSGCSTSASAEPQEPSQCTDLADLSNVSKTCDHSPLQDGNETDEGKIQVDGNANGNGDVPVEEDEEEDVDFNPFLKESNSLEASSSLSSEVEDLEMDVAHSRGKHSAPFDNKSKEIDGDILKDCRNGGNDESVEEVVMQNTVSESAYVMAMNDESALITQSENGSLFDKENGQTSPTDACNATHSRKTMEDLDTEDAICMRTRARYSLASFTLDELETFLQESDDEDDLQNVDDEAEYRKFLAAVRGDDDSQNLHENANADDEDEENDVDFELELEEALESEPEEVEERRMSKRNRCRKASIERSKKLSEQLSRPLRPLLPFGSFPAFDGKHLAPNISPYSIPPVNNGHSYGFTPHQIGQLYCLIHEHVQLLLQVFSICVLEPGKSQIASEVKDLVVQMHNKYEQALTWRRVPYPSFCFFPPYIHPSVSDRPHKILPSNGNDKSVQQNFPSGSNGALHSDTSSMHNERHNYLPDEQGNSSQTPERTSWVPYICGPVVSVMDVAPVRLIENYIDDVSSAVRSYEKHQIELGFEGHCQKEPLFPPRNFLCSAESDGQGEVETHPPDSGEMLSHSSNNQRPKKTMAASLLEKAKNQTIALVHKEIARLAQRFMPLFNPALYPHKPPPAPIANRVLFTDAEDELLALGLMEYNTDWKAIQQRFLPCKSRHQIFVRQKNRASSKAPENPIKAVRRIKNSPLTSEEIARIEVGLKKFKLDWISVWRFLVPYRDPSLLPRQWRIASGTQKSYKSDASKKAKRQLNESRRKSTKPSPSTWHSSSEKEGDSTDNAIEEANSGDNRMDKEDEAYVHEAFLFDWMPENNVSSIFPACMATGEGPQAREQYNSSVFGDIQPPMFFKSSAASRSSNSQVVLRPYRSRKPNAARLVKLAPDLPPVNLPPSVRVMSQSAFKSSHADASSKIPGTPSRISGIVVDNGDLHTRNILESSMKFGPSRNDSVISASSQYPNHPDVTIDKSVVDRSDSDLQMHPLLFQAPQDGDLRYYPSSTSPSRSFSFFSGNHPQLSLSLFHNPRHIRDAVNYLSKSSKPPESNAPSLSIDFHPLLQRTDNVDADSVATRPAGRLLSNAKSRQKCASIRNPSVSTSKPSPDGKVDKLDLNTHQSSASKNQESAGQNVIFGDGGRSVGAPSSKVIESESGKDSGRKRDSAPDRIACELDSDDVPGVTSRNEGRWEASDKIQNKSLPKKIIMEQEELSDSDEEFGDDVEFECEEMADSDGDSTSDSDQVVDLPSEEVRLDGTDADIDDVPVLGSDRSDYTSITCSTSDRRPFGLSFVEKGVNIKPNTSSLNLNSCLSVSPYSNPKNASASFEFGPFGTIGMSRENHHLVDSKESIRNVKPATVNIQKRVKDGERELLGGGELLRKRVCRSNTNSSLADVCVEGNSSPNMEMIAENLKNCCTDKI